MGTAKGLSPDLSAWIKKKRQEGWEASGQEEAAQKCSQGPGRACRRAHGPPKNASGGISPAERMAGNKRMPPALSQQPSAMPANGGAGQKMGQFGGKTDNPLCFGDAAGLNACRGGLSAMPALWLGWGEPVRILGGISERSAGRRGHFQTCMRKSKKTGIHFVCLPGFFILLFPWAVTVTPVKKFVTVHGQCH